MTPDDGSALAAPTDDPPATGASAAESSPQLYGVELASVRSWFVRRMGVGSSSLKSAAGGPALERPTMETSCCAPIQGHGPKAVGVLKLDSAGRVNLRQIVGSDPATFLAIPVQGRGVRLDRSDGRTGYRLQIDRRGRLRLPASLLRLGGLGPQQEVLVVSHGACLLLAPTGARREHS